MTFQPVDSLLFWFIATEWKQFFTIYALGFTGVCVAQQIGPIVKYPRIFWYKISDYLLAFIIFISIFTPSKCRHLARAARGGPPLPLCYATAESIKSSKITSDKTKLTGGDWNNNNDLWPSVAEIKRHRAYM